MNITGDIKMMNMESDLYFTNQTLVLPADESLLVVNGHLRACSVIWTLFLFAKMTSHFWLLNEGLCLLDILVLNVFTSQDNQPCGVYMIKFLCIGWVLPGMFILINVVYLQIQESKNGLNSCWSNQDQFSKIITNGS